ncbi:polymorphic toxin type 30 domain-containing protein [Streptomyces sp. NPDC057620]|uniref:polymorphic toxin type 30 domain-containing protein n=1 Tax=Streptomyces sp. NPDC057620 TaxID=3346185 RepID=UPI0036ABDFF3
MLDLEKDPTPGDPVRVKSLAKSLHDFADDVQDALRLVNGMAGEDAVLTMVGKTAEVFRDEFSGVPKNLKKLKKSYDLAGDALAAYWPELERAQTLADKALAKGRDAQADLSSAKSKLSSADSWVTRANKEADKYKDDPGSAGKDVPKPDEAKVRAATRDAQSAKDAHTAAQSDVTSAQSALDAAKKMAADARQMREDAAGEAKRKLDDASDAGIQNRKWYEEVGDWFVDNWDTIVAVCKVVVAVLGIIALIIGGPILGAIVLIAALVVLADTLNKYMKGQASLWDVAFAALDCIPGMKGLTTLGGLAKGLKGLRTMNGLKAGLKGMAAGVRGLGKSARGALADGAKGAYNRLKSVVRSKGSDPVDMATGAMYLPQIDLELPGSFPLTFTRRIASDYRCGWWFGPTWASTVDQRLEVDDDGIVFVTEDGLLLAYSHPTDLRTSVLPEAGPRWPLSRLHDDGYCISDPVTGHARYFARPAEGIALLARIADRNENAIIFDYDELGAPIAIRHTGGYHLKLTTDGGRITALALAGAAEDGSDVTIKRYGYTGSNLDQVVNSSGLPLKFTYDERLRVTSWTDTNHSRYSYTYDDRDRCIAEGGDAGHITITLDYDGSDLAWPGCQVTTLTTAEGTVSRFVINDNRQVIAEVDPVGAVTRTEYDEHHHVLSYMDALGRSTYFENNVNDQPMVISHPGGRETRAEYNALCRPTTLFEPDGSLHRQTYDERGNRTSATDPEGHTTHFTYDQAGHLASVTDPLGHTATIRCDGTGLPIEVVDPLGSVTRYEHDGFGRPVAVADPMGAVTRLDWTVEGKLARRTAPDGTSESWTYDGEGNRTSHTGAAGAVSHFEYTHFDLLAARTEPDGARYEFVHDMELRLTKVTNPQGLTWTYEYDAVGNLASETDFDDRTLTYDYDLAGRVTARTDVLGHTVLLERNTLGQVVRKNAAGHVTTYAHDLGDRLVEATSNDVTVTFSHDRCGRLRRETVDGRSTTYEYDALGRRTGRTTPSGARSTWTYDAAGNRTGMVSSGRSIDFTYDAAGRELTRRAGELLTVSQAYDPMGRLATQSVTADGRSIQNRTYTYRADGHVAGIDDQLSGTRRFDLDAVGRVTAVRAANWTERYAYDEAGNQMSASWPADHSVQGAVGERTYAGTRLISAGKVRYEHDELGRITLRQRTRLSRKPDNWHYEWNTEDRLTSVLTPDGTRWRYTYDPLGRRMAKLRLASDNETVAERVDFTWDGASLCEQTTEAPDLRRPVTLTWDHQGLRPIAQTERMGVVGVPQEEIDSRFFAIITDLVGTPSELVDEQGEIAWRARSTLWGSTAWSEDSATYTPLRFPGQYYDPETGLHYNYFRHYDPETARYLTSDPLGLQPAPNPATYVHNPHSWTDPLGLSPYPPRVKDGGWDLRGHGPLSMVPDNAEMRVLKPHPNGGAQKGVEYKWTDSETGNTVRVRVHDADGTAPPGSNAAKGDVYRISIGGKYQDEAGNLYHRNVHNPNSPHHNDAAAEATHIPWRIPFQLPY